MGIHSLVLPEGVDVDTVLARAAYEDDETCETQDNPSGLEWRLYLAGQADKRRSHHRKVALKGHSIRREKLKVMRRDPDASSYGD